MDKKNSFRFLNDESVYITCTPDADTKKTFFYVYDAGHLKKEDCSFFSSGRADMFLMLAVVSGRGILETDDEKYMLNEGDCVFIDCSSKHDLAGSDDEPWEIMWVHFSGCTSRQYYEYFASQSKNVFRPPFFDKAVSTLSELADINVQGGKNADIVSSKLIVDLLTLALTVSGSEHQFDTGLKQKLAAVHAYIDDHFSEDLSLEKLSSMFYISKYYLTREYRRIYGTTIFQHIISARINYGKELLRYSDKSVEDIAHLCGFNDQSYFARQFKKSENQTCFSYRKMWRK